MILMEKNLLISRLLRNNELKFAFIYHVKNERAKNVILGFKIYAVPPL